MVLLRDELYTQGAESLGPPGELEKGLVLQDIPFFFLFELI